jgi:sialate O-acetylesterase
MKRINNKMIIKFNNTGKGLVTNTTGKNVYGFEIAGVDQVFYDVKAVIKNNKVVLFTSGIQSPMHVRYSWRGDASKSNLFNNDGFPAVPFRTDDWNTITKEVKYKF